MGIDVCPTLFSTDRVSPMSLQLKEKERMGVKTLLALKEWTRNTGNFVTSDLYFRDTTLFHVVRR